MKTIQDIEAEIKSLMEYGIPEKREEKRLIFLRTCILFIETRPDENHLRESLDNQKRILILINDRYSEWLSNTPEARIVKNPRAKYNSFMGVRLIKKQIDNMEYILSS